ncbi:hypothetical protein [Paraclostridium bifermentans]|uniref:hypothetical protein n=1 Tax=Paraclostridium bifermentans TaxID=1490 RepID=UPI0018979673|nr:hypothetical protein [Paraclostridium bifermentans]MBU5289301.1 hypothetical protein [Paraclostridium bifermentans]
MKINISGENSQTTIIPPSVFIIDDIAILLNALSDEKFHKAGYITPNIIAEIAPIQTKFQVYLTDNDTSPKNIEINNNTHINVSENI